MQLIGVKIVLMVSHIRQLVLLAKAIGQDGIGSAIGRSVTGGANGMLVD